MKKSVFLKSIAYVAIAAIFNMQLSTIAYGVKISTDADESSSSHGALSPPSPSPSPSPSLYDDPCLIAKLNKYISVPIVGEWLSAQDVCKLRVASTNKTLWNAAYILHPTHENFKTLWKSIAGSYKEYIPEDEWEMLSKSDGLFIQEYLKKQHLRVLVNASINLEDPSNSFVDLDNMGRLIVTYNLGPSRYPFRSWMNLNDIGKDENDVYWKEVRQQGNKKALLAKHYSGGGEWVPGYVENPEAARKFNDSLVEKGDQDAIQRKINGLANGFDGYKKDPEAASQFNDSLVEKGDQDAIQRKINGHVFGWYGYEKNPAAARKCNDSLVEKGDQDAIQRKINGFEYGMHGYEKNPGEIGQLKDLLVAQNDQDAIFEKIYGLEYGAEGYDRDPEAGRQFLDSLLFEPEGREAILIKIKLCGLVEGGFGYERDLEAARQLNDSLVEKGDHDAIQRKIDGLANGVYGYEQNPVAARKFNDSLVEQNDEEAIDEKRNGLEYGNNLYEIDLEAAKKFNDSLVAKGNKEAIQRKIEGLNSGDHGYEEDPVAAEQFRMSLLINALDQIDDPVLQSKKLGTIEFVLKDVTLKADIQQRKEFIEALSQTNSSLVIDGFSLPAIAKAQKAICMKHGMLGYGKVLEGGKTEKDLEGARAFIIKNNIPY